MDPISQAALGASLSQSFAKNKSNQKSALVIGALAGMAPDLDVLIRSAADPILFLEFHRQFTHSLIFIPFGALLCALVFYQFYKSRLSFKQVYVFSFLGFATHGLLDACTSYGTQLLWPFSHARIAWNTVSIIDPLFTLPVIIFIVLAVKKKNIFYARISFIYAVLFLALGVVQNNRAEKALYELAAQRNHQVERIHVKPSFANRHLWKLIYEYDGRYYVDAVKLLSDVEIIPGTSIQKLDVKRDFPWLPKNSQQAKDIERFRWFSDDFLAVSQKDSMLIMDVRYSFLPNKVKSMWGITLDKNKVDAGDNDGHVGYEMKRELNKETYDQFIDMLF
ncbi:Integral membrane protein [hydrothermal vent metagenome]|uniref:Integral membrane protein n=1 Tax=hydrothermal vent metagenome TaxID=652676 RepID=A0A3B0WDX5_9ZZZZ